MTAWHNDPKLKERTVEAMRKDRELDVFVKGIYFRFDPTAAENYRGCAIGCLVAAHDAQALLANGNEEHDATEPEQGWHERAEELYGIPAAIGHMIDTTFEKLPTSNQEHATFVIDVLDAIPVGGDLSLVTSRMMLDLLDGPEYGVLRLAKDDDSESAKRGFATAQAVADLYRRRLDGDEPTEQEWEGAAWAARDARAAEAAWAARDARAAEAASAAWDARAARAAEAAYFPWFVSRLIQHLSEAPVLASEPA